MRFLANENVSSSIVEGLRAAGHDVVAVKEWLPGASDDAVRRRAQAEGPGPSRAADALG